MKKSIILLLLLAVIPLYAQTSAEYEAFVGAAQENSVLYRGRQATRYEFSYNGLPYWSTDEFMAGDVEYNGKHYYGVLLNIDACTQDLLVRLRPEMPAVVLDRDHVSGCIIDGTSYTNLYGQGVGKSEEGYYAVFSEGEIPVYMRVDKKLRRGTGNNNEVNMSYGDPDFMVNASQYFAARTRYYTIKNGALKSISRRKANKYAAYEE